MSDITPVTRQLRRAECAGKPASDRQLIMKNQFIGHDRFLDATKAVAKFHMPVKGGVPDFGSLFVLAGEPRTGKSYVLRRYAGQSPANVYGPEGVVRPVIYVDLPIACNKHGFVAALAEALNVGDPSRMKTDALWGNVVNGLIRQQVNLIILDEVQEAFASGRPGALKDCLGLIRKVLNLRTLNIVAAGLVDTYEIMAANTQLKGRGLLPYHLMQPYSWENHQERQLFRLLCDAFDEELPFMIKSRLGTKWFAARLYWVTDGIIGLLHEFVYKAGCMALNEDADSVTVQHFADAWDLIRPVAVSFNPFRDDLDQAPQRPVPTQPTLQPKDPFREAFVK
ncbi:TniB family NTP-binding protein [Methylobacterium radiotolerans]|uniref:TniB family NTP-binding protein n=1 Tax=Methylobacterium radiotolerans TaxID=31998 RepID=UPI001F3F967A|nr:TniB family NTP-binding protein [Methylobacterium radiotolerans]UIY43418.1 TniB family NTP-binding protein [Methylobacterium radiotolerans]